MNFMKIKTPEVYQNAPIVSYGAPLNDCFRIFTMVSGVGPSGA